MFKCLMILIIMAGLEPLEAQSRTPNPKLIARMEKRLAAVEARHKRKLAKLRQVYRNLKAKLEAPTVGQKARLQAELARVLEPVLQKARKIGSGSRSRLKKLRLHFKRSLPLALAKLEEPVLKALAPYIQVRLKAVLAESQSLADALTLSPAAWSSRALQALLDPKMDFYLKWNAMVADALPEVRAFVAVRKDLKQTKSDLKVARDPLLKWQVGAPPGFARIPSGTYVMNNTAGYAGTGLRKGNRKFTLKKSVYLGLKEVTNREYLAWLDTLADRDQRLKYLPKDASRRKILWELDTTTRRYRPPAGTLDQPVVGIRLDSALLYARFRHARLPTEEEWCAAASGPKGWLYPWGPDFVEGRCNSKEAALNELVAVGSYPSGRGPFGHFDLAGNASEWTMTYESGKRIEPEKIDDASAVIRGGSFLRTQGDVSSGWVWFRQARFDQTRDLGFRLAMDPAPPSKGK